MGCCNPAFFPTLGDSVVGVHDAELLASGGEGLLQTRPLPQ